MLINYDVKKIYNTIQDFYNATGIHMDLRRPDFSAVCRASHKSRIPYCVHVQNTSAGKPACEKSDEHLLMRCRETRTVQMHVCHAGLMDIAAPILYGDMLLGYIVFGQLRTDSDFSAVESYIESLGLNTAQMRKFYAGVPFYDSDRIDSIIRIACLLIQHLLLENMLRADFDENLHKIITFIQENLDKELTVRTISKGAGVSKSVLYNRFHACFNCTVSAYVNTRRIEQATELLQKTNLTVEEISQRVGFTTASYFSKMFKKQTGFTPLKFRKTQKRPQS